MAERRTGEQAWGRWGADDERGAPNTIGAEQVKRAASLVRTGRILSLAQPMSPKTPVAGHRAPMQHFMMRDGGDYAAGAKLPAGGFQFAEDAIVVPLQFATHMDALCHAWYENKLYNGFASNTIRSTTGAGRCGIEKMGPMMTRGVLLDVCAVAGAPLKTGVSVDASMLEKAAARGNVKLESGDAVVIRTGWNESMLKHPDYYDGEPGIDVSAGQWLADRDVAVVGADNYAVEVLPFPPGEVFPVHKLLMRGYGIPLMEGLIVDELAKSGASTFLFIVQPLPIVGGTGSPIAPIAVL
jgi:kynurenine formamidase